MTDVDCNGMTDVDRNGMTDVSVDTYRHIDIFTYQNRTKCQSHTWLAFFLTMKTKAEADTYTQTNTGCVVSPEINSLTKKIKNFFFTHNKQE